MRFTGFLVCGLQGFMCVLQGFMCVLQGFVCVFQALSNAFFMFSCVHFIVFLVCASYRTSFSAIHRLSIIRYLVILVCVLQGFLYYGMQSGIDCYCGNGGYDKYGATDRCTTKCGGDSLNTCGGDLAIEVYKIGEKHVDR